MNQTKTSPKWKLATLIFILAVVVGLYIATVFLPWYMSPEKEAYREWKAKQDSALESAREDRYGSTTPQGTLDLFISALEKGDTETASKYFVQEKQTVASQQLRAGSENVLRVVRLEDRKQTEPSEGIVVYYYNDHSNLPEYSITLILNPTSHLWKLESL